MEILQFSLLLIILRLVFAQNDANIVSSTKAKLARRLFINEGVRAVHNIGWHQNWKTTGEGMVKSGSLFKSFGTHYIYTNNSIMKLELNTSKELQPLHTWSNRDNSLITQQVDEGGYTFLASCYEARYCDIELLTAQPTNVRKVQSIFVEENPRKLHFFVHERSLYLMMVANHSTVYKWHETYFDEEDVLATPGAQDVDSFYSNGVTVLAFAQNQWTYISKVFVKKSEKLELNQLLTIEEPSMVKYFSVPSEESGPQHYFLFLSPKSGNQIFWWNFKDLSRWRSAPKVENQQLVFTAQLQTVPFVFITSERHISIFEASLQGLTLLNKVESDGEAVEISVEDDQVMLLTNDGPTKFSIIAVDMSVRTSVQDSKHQYSVRGCLTSLEKILQERRQFLDNAATLTFNPIETRLITKAIISKQTVFQDVVIQKLAVKPDGKSLKATPSNLKKTLKGYQLKFPKLNENLKRSNMNKNRLVVHGDIYVKHLKANATTVEILNKEKLAMDNFLSLSLDQTMDGDLSVSQLAATRLEISRLNSYSPEDLLQRNLSSQSITGEKAVLSIVSNAIRFTEDSSVNGVKFSNYANTATGEPIQVHGTKTLQHLAASSLSITRINKDTFGIWYEKIRPEGTMELSIEPPLVFQNLSVGSLQVDKINNVSWTQISKHIVESKEKGRDHKIIQNLIASKINGQPIGLLMTKNGTQSVSSEMHVTSLNADYLTFKTMNNYTRNTISNLLQTIILSEFPEQNSANISRANNNGNETQDFGASFNDTTSARTAQLGQNRLQDIIREELQWRICPLLSNNRIKVNNYVIIYGDIYVEDSTEARVINNIDTGKILSKIILLSDVNSTKNITYTKITADAILPKKLNLMKLRTSRKVLKLLKVNGSLSVSSFTWVKPRELSALTLTGSQIYGNLIISGDIKGMINHVDFRAFLSSMFFKSREQLINETYYVDNIFAANLTAAYVNNIHLNNILYGNHGNISINSDLVFNRIGVKGNVIFQSWKNCPLLQVAEWDVSKVSTFHSMEVLSNVSWTESIKDMKSLSYITENIVLRNDLNAIEGPIIFKNSVTLHYLDTKQGINDIDISPITKDAIFVSKHSQKIKTEVFLKGNIRVGNATFKRNVVVDTVDGINIEDFNDNLYRLDDEIEVTGFKKFENGFTAFNLKAGIVHNVKSDNLVLIDDLMNGGNTARIPHITFDQVQVLHNLTADNINGMNLTLLINHRVSLSSNETISKNFYINGKAKISGAVNCSKINDVNFGEIFSIKDRKILIEGPLSIENMEFYLTGDVTAKDVNEFNISGSYETSIKTGENSTIKGNVSFKQDVYVKGCTAVDEISSCNIRELYETIDSYEPAYLSSAQDNISIVEQLSRKMPREVILQHLEHNSSLNISLVNVKETVVSYMEDETTIDLYGMTDEACGLPKNCLCPRQLTYSIHSQLMTIKENNLRQFQFVSASLKASIQVKTTTISYSNRCKLREGPEERTVLQWRTLHAGDAGELTLVDGYLSDVKFFTLGDSIYAVLSFYYNGNTSESRNLNVSVYELRVSKAQLDKIDSIPAKGAVSVDLIWAQPGYLLVIGNTKSEDPASDTVYTELYRFDERTNKFKGLRKIGSHGVLDMKAVKMNKDAFLFIVQKKPWPLLAFKYSAEYDNFLFFEKFQARHGFISVTSITFAGAQSEQVYIGMVLANDEFRILKYKYVEGFVEILSGRQEGIMALECVTTINGELLITVSSPPFTSRILRIINS